MAKKKKSLIKGFDFDDQDQDTKKENKAQKEQKQQKSKPTQSKQSPQKEQKAQNTQKQQTKQSEKKITYYIRNEYDEGIRAIAWYDRRTITSVINEALGDYIKKNLTEEALGLYKDSNESNL